MKMCFYKKKKKRRDLPIDYQTGSCHGGKKDGEGEHKEYIRKVITMGKGQQNVKLNR